MNYSLNPSVVIRDCECKAMVLILALANLSGQESRNEALENKLMFCKSNCDLRKAGYCLELPTNNTVACIDTHHEDGLKLETLIGLMPCYSQENPIMAGIEQVGI
jgi:hypothetical protein